MQNLRIYGSSPFRVAVIHGGPGAPGEMAPLARKLSAVTGVLEPLQTSASLEGQVEELEVVLRENGDLPVILIGHSWGAWLSYIVTARYPALVKKLVLIGSGAYEEKYAIDIMETRLNRLTEAERIKTLLLIEVMADSSNDDKSASLAEFGRLMFKADSYHPLPYRSEVLEFQYEVNKKVWADASEMRSSGRLLALGKQIRCPVVAIHGDYDPHLAAGVRDPLNRVLRDFRFILLERCGHYPWLEKEARDNFYNILTAEIKQ